MYFPNATIRALGYVFCLYGEIEGGLELLADWTSQFCALSLSSSKVYGGRHFVSL